MQFALFIQKRCIASLIGFGTPPEVRGGEGREHLLVKAIAVCSASKFNALASDLDLYSRGRPGIDPSTNQIVEVHPSLGLHGGVGR